MAPPPFRTDSMRPSLYQGEARRGSKNPSQKIRPMGREHIDQPALFQRHDAMHES